MSISRGTRCRLLLEHRGGLHNRVGIIVRHGLRIMDVIWGRPGRRVGNIMKIRIACLIGIGKQPTAAPRMPWLHHASQSNTDPPAAPEPRRQTQLELGLEQLLGLLKRTSMELGPRTLVSYGNTIFGMYISRSFILYLT